MIKFGTGGWRALIGEEFTRENVEKVAYGVAACYRAKSKEADNNNRAIVIGYDNRFLSKEAAKWLADKLVSYGVPVRLLNNSTTSPFVMYLVKTYQLWFGLMVTASHNPYNYNGIKVFTEGGVDASKEFTDKLEDIINNKTIRIAPKKVNGIYTTSDPEMFYEQYFESMGNFINLNAVKKYKKKILFDPRFGSATDSFLALAEKLGLKVDIINSNVDAYFGKQLPAPNEETTGELADKVKKKHYSVGIMFDGDGDRLGVVDEEGNYVSMNKLLCIFFYYCKAYRNIWGGIVKNTVTTCVLDRIADFYDSTCETVPVGFKNISNILSSRGDIFIGGESSGGVTVSKHIMGKDSTFSTLLLLEILSVTKKPLSKLSKEIDKKFGKTIWVENSISYKDKNLVEEKVFNFKKRILELGKGAAVIDRSDGEKYDIPGTDSWVSIRYSGTEPLVRLTWEYDDSKNLSPKVISYIHAARVLLEELKGC